MRFNDLLHLVAFPWKAHGTPPTSGLVAITKMPESRAFSKFPDHFSSYIPLSALEGWRRVEVTDRRTRIDWARVVRKLVDEDYPDKDRIVLVMDNLNTHHPASLYEAFEPAEARRIAERLEIHYTPKHGSWLNMAEIELGVLARQCLDRRIPHQEILTQETEAWQDQRNRDTVRVDWRFTTQDARVKLKSLYPLIQ